MFDAIVTYQRPRNESPEHFLLKNVALCWMKVKWKCQCVGDEIWGVWRNSPIEKGKAVADAVGVRIEGGINSTIYCIEAKVSISDFRNGFCTGGDLNYIIAPTDLLTTDMLPPNIGLMEVDFDKLSRPTGNDITGVKIAKRAKRLPRVLNHEYVIQNIASANTNKLIYNNPWFPEGYGVGKSDTIILNMAKEIRTYRQKEQSCSNCKHFGTSCTTAYPCLSCIHSIKRCPRWELSMSDAIDHAVLNNILGGEDNG